ncbi:MAG: DUF4159 domain-containing protein [Verrucomicrobiota bacterium]|nr:DUF4159 domain-containing protein [Verrucomicrobiota bacterium]
MAKKKTTIEKGKDHLGVIKRFVYALMASRFFLIALGLHVALLAIFGGIVIVEAVKHVVTGQFESTDFIAMPPGPPPAPPSDANPNEVDVEIPQTDVAETSAPDMKDIIVSENASAPSFMPEINVSASVGPNVEKIQTQVKNIPTPTAARKSAPAMSKERLSSINTRMSTGAEGSTPFGVGNTAGGGVTGVQGQFTCYVAKYAGGDWDQNIKLSADGQRVEFGGIPNLMTQITRWNKRLKANVQGVPLDLSDRNALFGSKPPVAFVYFTGHKDFKLTDAEVTNIRDFLLAGGVIWGDAGMPGRNSRFDIAFRREMRRVLPDPDQDFQPIDDRHPIFTQKGSLLKTTPSGINFYKEPIEVMMIGDQIGVLYTMNSYGKIWQVALNDKDKVLEQFDEGTQKAPNQTYTNFALWSRRNTYYRNVNNDTVVLAYKLGINVVVHLLLQYQAVLVSAPKVN